MSVKKENVKLVFFLKKKHTYTMIIRLNWITADMETEHHKLSSNSDVNTDFAFMQEKRMSG